MRLDRGAELKGSIVFHSLLKAGLNPAKVKKHHLKLQAYGNAIAERAQSSAALIDKAGQKLLKTPQQSYKAGVILLNPFKIARLSGY